MGSMAFGRKKLLYQRILLVGQIALIAQTPALVAPTILLRPHAPSPRIRRFMRDRERQVCGLRCRLTRSCINLIELNREPRGASMGIEPFAARRTMAAVG